MQCPRQCGVELRAVEVAGIPSAVHLCDKCEGAWYPQEAMFAVAEVDQETLTRSDLGVVLVGDHLESVDLEHSLNCPVCSQVMSRFSYVLSPDIKLDECGDHGTWLDDGELGTILERLAEREREKVLSPEEAAEKAEAKAQLDAAARGGSILNPFSLTIRALNALFSKRSRN